ncbi:PadR family transcriptional regulator [Natrinema sp. DC36]|uniref:PadR family transcriptional regulator n=1 Tax=Natrinema sp. DC36 TaxID=2878680 RepID=UPI001CEFEE62|nr:PadR family transcriptional regulator [Natrinema sp. DC36]
MNDDLPWGRERLDRANESPTNYPATDGRSAWIELTAFQRDCLEAIARLERDDVPCDERAITQTLERAYPSVDRLRLDPNLRTLVGRGLLEKRRLEARVEYLLTDDGRALLLQRAERFADACGIGATEFGADEVTAREAGEQG